MLHQQHTDDDKNLVSNLGSVQTVSTTQNSITPKGKLNIKPQRGRRKRTHETSPKLKESQNIIDRGKDLPKEKETLSTIDVALTTPRRRKNRYNKDIKYNMILFA